MTWIASLRAALEDNPVFRRELKALTHDRRQNLAAFLLWGVFALIFAGGLYVGGAERAMVGYLLFGLHALVAVLHAASTGATCISREQEQQTWEGLVLTRLAPHEIVLGKAAAVAAGALGVSLPAFPPAMLLLLLAGVGPRPEAAPLGRMLVAEALLVVAVLLYVALAVSASALHRRSSAAASSMGVTALFTLQFPAAAIIATFRPDLSVAMYAAQMAALLLLGSSTALLLLAGCSTHMPGSTRAYTAPARLSGAVAYLSGLLFFLLLWSGSPVPSAVAALLALHAAAAMAGVVALCAGALPARSEEPGKPLEWHPLSRRCGGGLAYWLLLHVGVLIGAAIAGVVAGWSRAGWSPSPEGLAREIGASTSCLLLCGGFACLVAARFPARPARWRIGIAAILPLAMLVLPVLLSLHSAFAPDAQAVLSRIAPLAVLDPVTYLFDWPLSFEVRWIGQPPAWQASLGLQLLAACGLLLAAFRRPSARKG